VEELVEEKVITMLWSRSWRRPTRSLWW
jgi:hypothetical protein